MASVTGSPLGARRACGDDDLGLRKGVYREQVSTTFRRRNSWPKKVCLRSVVTSNDQIISSDLVERGYRRSAAGFEPRCRRERILASSSGALNGLVTYSSAPASRTARF